MSNSKITTETTYTYITTDCRKFDDYPEAEEWQGYLSTVDGIRMLDYNFEPTKIIAHADYVCIITEDQKEAFNKVSSHYGLSEIDKVGYHLYNEDEDCYENIDNKIRRLQTIIDRLKGGVEE